VRRLLTLPGNLPRLRLSPKAYFFFPGHSWSSTVGETPVFPPPPDSLPLSFGRVQSGAVLGFGSRFFSPDFFFLVEETPLFLRSQFCRLTSWMSTIFSCPRKAFPPFLFFLCYENGPTLEDFSPSKDPSCTGSVFLKGLGRRSTDLKKFDHGRFALRNPGPDSR